MAADKTYLASALLRVARKSGNAKNFVMDLIEGRFSRVIGGNGRILISASSAGASATWSVPVDVVDSDIIQIAEMAMQILEAECGEQVASHNRILTYGLFGNIMR